MTEQRSDIHRAYDCESIGAGLHPRMNLNRCGNQETGELYRFLPE
jgi:hypothetical protein